MEAKRALFGYFLDIEGFFATSSFVWMSLMKITGTRRHSLPDGPVKAATPQLPGNGLKSKWKYRAGRATDGQKFLIDGPPVRRGRQGGGTVPFCTVLPALRSGNRR